MVMTSLQPRVNRFDEAELDALIVLDPREPGRANARLRDHGHHVWAIIDYLQARYWDIDTTMADWGLSEQEVRAAIRYYERNKAFVEAKILLVNDARDES